MLYIVPYTAEHGKFILSCQMNHALMDKDARFEGDAMNLVQDHLSFTGLVGKKPIFAAGMKMIWGQVAEGWVIEHKMFGIIHCQLLKQSRKILPRLQESIILKEFKLL